jgi:pyruvate formate-lyase activating enzyme-like uncharacterized protein
MFSRTYTGPIMELETGSDSFYTHLPHGCRLCYEGAKMVLFVTGLCRKSCFYCPVSRKRIYRDVIFANERPVSSDNDIINEARSMNALGTGITGGEPLLVPERVLRYIRLLKAGFGREHHIHLYTALSPGRVILKELTSAGLDEIRFHPPPEIWNSLHGSEFASSLGIAIELGMDAGFEIPSLPGSGQVADFARDFDVFINLDELEFSQTNAEALKARGYSVKDDESCRVAGSMDVAYGILQQNPGSKVHFCSSRYKDAVQLRRRLLRMARILGREFDEVTPDGTLFYGVIQGNVDDITGMLNGMDVPWQLFETRDGRIELAWWVLEDIAQEIGDRFRSWYEECYPAYGRLVIERIPIDTTVDFTI